MRVSPISVYPKTSLLKSSNSQVNRLKEDGPIEQPTTDTVAFKGVKNALKAGSLYALAGAIVGAITLPAMGVLAGAATLAGIVGTVGTIAGAMQDDKDKITFFDN